jgi:hypothetical protein
MSIWKNCTLCSVTTATNNKSRIPCEVRIEGNSLVISYADDKGPAVYMGSRVEADRFSLACIARNGRATAHFVNDHTLEGTAEDDEGIGEFRIELR